MWRFLTKVSIARGWEAILEWLAGNAIPVIVGFLPYLPAWLWQRLEGIPASLGFPVAFCVSVAAFLLVKYGFGHRQKPYGQKENSGGRARRPTLVSAKSARNLTMRGNVIVGNADMLRAEQLEGFTGYDNFSIDQFPAKDLPYSPSWETNPAFAIEQAAWLWVGLEPDTPTVPGHRAYPILQRLIYAADFGYLAVSGGVQNQPWSRVASRESWIDYCDATGQRPDFLYSENDQTFISFQPAGRMSESNNLDGWAGSGEGVGSRWTVRFKSPIPVEKQVFYVSEATGAKCRMLRRTDNDVQFEIEEMVNVVKITFD